MNKSITEMITAAIVAANTAGDTWIKTATVKFTVHQSDVLGNQGPTIGHMLDLCGNAHVKFRDKRSSDYKQFKKAGQVRGTGNGVVEISHKYRGRQEFGLQEACAQAAKNSLENGGVTGLTIWSYID